MPTDHHPRPRRVRRVLELERRRRAARRRRPSRSSPTPTRCASIAGDAAGLTELVRSDRRTRRARRPLLRRGRHHQRRRPTPARSSAWSTSPAFALEAGESPADAAALRARRDARPRRSRPSRCPAAASTLYIAAGQVPPSSSAPTCPSARPQLMAITQRPITEAALGEPLGRRAAVEDGSELVHLRRARTATSRPAHTASWPSGPAPGAPSRSPARRTSSASRTPRRPPS